ncbi:hypothetical protein EPD60_07020 [Flaviaesturariibacter flavus]|uniref:Uncharacterized protein n=1 Tax=Flaviaesturariibacter flavus TaxID=2502780 RepID=A0A4R1BIE6_9BACT|nr:DUF3142 domain-containing protein [Flaviaesturariibacter flavus]TCJ17056.1 hypothetical protein EPD60_07020 [Flaviaesturariibacter flavus]
MEPPRARPTTAFLLFFLAIFTSCRERSQVTRAYYYWRSSEPEASERHFVKKTGLQKLYVRQLDVDWDPVQGAVPMSEGSPEKLKEQLRLYDSVNPQFVPVVFITNKVFEQIDTVEAVSLLARRVARRCLPGLDAIDLQYEDRHYLRGWGGAIRPREVQVDCDWTVATAPAYFAFLRALRRQVPDSIRLSATIRLHQYKHFSKTGVPPVNRGMLMIYNISDPTRYGPGSSIFDEKKAAAYFDGAARYPLPLDMALPAFSWTLIFRKGKFYGIQNSLDEEKVRALSFVTHKGGPFYAVTQDTVFNDIYLRPGDELKVEQTSVADLRAAAALAQTAVNTRRYSVALFELSENEIKHYGHDTLSAVYASFR